jgi:hypothetical protein
MAHSILKCIMLKLYRKSVHSNVYEHITGLTPRSTAILKKLTVPQPDTKFPLLRILKVHCRVRKRPTLVPYPEQINPVHPLESHTLKVHFTIILCVTPRNTFIFYDNKWALAQPPSRWATSCRNPTISCRIR